MMSTDFARKFSCHESRRRRKSALGDAVRDIRLFVRTKEPELGSAILLGAKASCGTLPLYSTTEPLGIRNVEEQSERRGIDDHVVFSKIALSLILP